MDWFLYDNGLRHERVKIQDLWQATLNTGFDISSYHLINACTVKDPPRSNGNIQSSESQLGMPLSKIKDGVTGWFLIEETIAAGKCSELFY